MSYRTLSSQTRSKIASLLSHTGLSQGSIAAKCRVAPSTVGRIAREIGIDPLARKAKHKSRALTSRNQEIVRLADAGLSYAEIGRRFDISRERVRRIVERYTALWLKSA